MLQKQQNYKRPKTCTGHRADNRQRKKRFKADKNAIRPCYTLMQTNKAFYIIFIIAIYRLDTKLAKKPCVKGFRPATRGNKTNNFIKIYLLDTRLLGMPNK